MISPATPHSASKSILCVEDDEDTCDLLAVVLAEFEFRSERSVSSAIETIRHRRHDLYILDSWLPDGSGIDVCLEIRRAHADVPVIFTSAAARLSDIDDGLRAGADRYLVKPLEPNMLRQIVKELIYRT